MTNKQVEYALATYSKDNLQLIIMDNFRRIVLEEDNLDKVEFSEEQEMVIYEEETTLLNERHDFTPMSTIHLIPYSGIQSLVFRK